MWALSGCSTLGYYWQAAAGHLQIMSAAKPVEQWLGDETTSARLKERLALAQRLRRYAVTELKLPDNASYHRYADLKRNAALWNVVAAPEYSLKLKTWCFPVVGCVSYRGYFDENKAKAEASTLSGEGWEAAFYPVPAYSTLGLLNWMGGDPLLNTFIYYPEGELARLIFHELAHQVVYVPNDSTFNESFATAVERIGSARWLASQSSEQARRDYAAFDARRQQFRALTHATRERLKTIYGEDETPTTPTLPLEKRAELKRLAFQDFRQQYAQLRASWGGDSARWRFYDQWVEQANNASFGAQATYDELVPGFEALFAREGGNWDAFYAEVKRLAELPKEKRHELLKSEGSGG